MQFANAHVTRHIDIIHPDQLKVPIHIIGAGAIGSFSAMLLAKMGAEDITVWDMDTVSVENMSCQFYRFKDIGTSKVLALRELVQEFTNVAIKPMQKEWTPQTVQETRGIVISAVDSMAVRKALFDFCQKDFRVKFFIDSRMGAETALLYCMNPQNAQDRTSYANTFYTDENSVQEKCTAKATTYTASLLSGMVVKTVKDLLTQETYPRITQWSIKDNDFQCWVKQ